MASLDKHLLFTPSSMALIDASAQAGGFSILSLMDRAGKSVAAAALKHYPGAMRYVVLCGIGNNGGDGFVAACFLRDCGADVAVYLFGDPAKMTHATAHVSAMWGAPAASLNLYVPRKGDVVIDAIFGAGLSRPVPEVVAETIRSVTEANVPVIAVDLPSGLCGRRGVPLGSAFQAHRTITFMAKKPGHVLVPGRMLCGELDVFDIGIPRRIMAQHAEDLWGNHPDLWSRFLISNDMAAHKFKRGHLTVFSGPAHATGAARMTATAGLRAGAGIVTIAASADAIPALSTSLTAVMVSEVDTVERLEGWRDDARHGTYVLGPGFGNLDLARQFVSLLSDKALVLDADGITAFKNRAEELFEIFAASAPRILTPHEGEFARLFPQIHRDGALSKIEKAQGAAKISNCVIVYKGPDTVIAAPDGRAIVNTNAPPYLATAGSGDVLAGIAGGLLAQQVPAFEAAAAAVWLHGEAANRLGAGLTAEDLAAAVRPYDPPVRSTSQ